jgi:polyhydroxybutyrate depolymerase
MKRLSVLALGFALFAAPAQYAAAAPPSDPQQSVSVDGMDRTYLLHVPPQHDPEKPMPLVIVLHGHGGSAGAMVGSTGFDAIADREGFVVAYLQGTKGSDGKAGWNTGITPDPGITVNDVKFVRKVAAHLQTKLGVDPKRIYAAGFSNGGFMSHRLAAQASDLLAAVGVVEGTVGTQQDGAWLDIAPAKGPIPIAIVHGKKDTTVPYAGGTTANGHTFRSVADAVARWVKTNGCTGKPVKKTVIAGKVLTADYNTCKAKSEVLLYTLVEGQHQWPNTTNAGAISGGEELWKFFTRHHKP